jgi:hypothetical protein
MQPRRNRQGNNGLKQQVKLNSRLLGRLNSALEKKFFLTARVNSLLPGTANDFMLNGIVNGTDFQSRIGSQVIIKYIDINIYFDNIMAAPNGLRVYVIEDKRTANQTAPTWVPAEVFVNGVGPAEILNSIQDPTTRARFKIHYDKMYLTTPVNTFYDRGFIRIRLPLNRRIRYNGNTGTSSDILNSAFYLAFLSATAGAFYVTFDTVTAFVDS